MNKFMMVMAAGAIAWTATVSAAELQVLSAGAVEPGLVRVAELFRQRTGSAVKVQFETAPRIAKRLAEGETVDVVILPPAALDEQGKLGRALPAGRVLIGRVGAGVVVRANLPSPTIATTNDLKQAMLAADSIVYNTASSGLYLEKLFDRIGIGEQIRAKTTRYATGEGVMEHIIKGKGNEIGFGAVTEIKLFEPKGVKLVGPLPSDIQNYTAYEAALMVSAPSADAAESFLSYLATPETKQIFVAVGIE